LIHNPQVLRLLEEKNVQILDQIPSCGSGTVLIRAHGVPPDVKNKLARAGFDTVDATCPRVLKVQGIINKFARQGYTTIIVGDDNHPEVIGLLGYANGSGYVVSGMEDMRSLPTFEKAIVVAQTTQNTEHFRDVEAWVQDHCPHYMVFETICDSTEKRQTEIKKMAQSVDAVVVVGGYGSGNTRRLAEVAAQSGKPVFHVETEADLLRIDPDTLGSASIIGVTAGASTPNWTIKEVRHALEQLPLHEKGRWVRRLLDIQRLLVMTNLYLALGAGSLTYACSRLLRIPNAWPCVAVSALYVQSMHVLNNLTGTKADRPTAPDRAGFYERNRITLSTIAVMSSLMGLSIGWTMGISSFLLLLLMTVTGMCYNLRIVPKLSPIINSHRIRDIPGSKTILISAAWGVLAAILPSLSVSGKVTATNLLLFVFFAALVFVRTAFFDVLDMQADRFVGRETIAIVLGEKRTMRILTIILVALVLGLLTGSALQWIMPLGYSLTICPIAMLLILNMYRRGYLLAGFHSEFFVDSLFLLAGFFAILWPA
jgi:4-hydroxy-3-methylbut-2-enyl diphosphate reductase